MVAGVVRFLAVGVRVLALGWTVLVAVGYRSGGWTLAFPFGGPTPEVRALLAPLAESFVWGAVLLQAWGVWAVLVGSPGRVARVGLVLSSGTGWTALYHLYRWWTDGVTHYLVNLRVVRVAARATLADLGGAYTAGYADWVARKFGDHSDGVEALAGLNSPGVDFLARFVTPAEAAAAGAAEAANRWGGWAPPKGPTPPTGWIDWTTGQVGDHPWVAAVASFALIAGIALAAWYFTGSPPPPPSGGPSQTQQILDDLAVKYVADKVLGSDPASSGGVLSSPVLPDSSLSVTPVGGDGALVDLLDTFEAHRAADFALPVVEAVLEAGHNSSVSSTHPQVEVPEVQSLPSAPVVDPVSSNPVEEGRWLDEPLLERPPSPLSVVDGRVVQGPSPARPSSFVVRVRPQDLPPPPPPLTYAERMARAVRAGLTEEEFAAAEARGVRSAVRSVRRFFQEGGPPF